MKLTILIMILAPALSACMPSTVLNTTSLRGEPADGLYDVMLYGMDTPHDVETIAVLDRKDDSYQILPAIRLDETGIYSDVKKEEAVQKALAFLYRSVIINRVEGRAILSPNGEIVGYEFTPEFYDFQISNSFYHRWYTLHDNNIIKFHVTWNNLHDPFSTD